MYTHEKKFQLNCWCKTSMYILFLKLLIALNASMNVTFYYSFFVGFVFPFSDWICNCTLWNYIEYLEFLYIACIYRKENLKLGFDTRWFVSYRWWHLSPIGQIWDGAKMKILRRIVNFGRPTRFVVRLHSGFFQCLNNACLVILTCRVPWRTWITCHDRDLYCVTGHKHYCIAVVLGLRALSCWLALASTEYVNSVGS